MFTMSGIMAVPYLDKFDMRFEIIDMPANRTGLVGVPRHSRLHPAGTEGTANVEVIAFLTAELAKPSNLLLKNPR